MSSGAKSVRGGIKCGPRIYSTQKRYAFMFSANPVNVQYHQKELSSLSLICPDVLHCLCTCPFYSVLPTEPTTQGQVPSSQQGTQTTADLSTLESTKCIQPDSSKISLKFLMYGADIQMAAKLSNTTSHPEPYFNNNNKLCILSLYTNSGTESDMCSRNESKWSSFRYRIMFSWCGWLLAH